MIKTLIGRKVGMTQVFAEDGTATPVTLIQAGPCTVTQVKTGQTDGYLAVQMGFGSRKAKNVPKPEKGHVEKLGKGCFQVLREVRTETAEDFTPGDELGVDIFEVGEKVDVIGDSKGKGFAGTIKRYHFSRGPMTHGCKNIREPGSTGNNTDPGRVILGKKMPGHMGDRRITVMNLKVVDVRPEQNLLLVKGAVPGATNGIVMVRKTNRVGK